MCRNFVGTVAVVMTFLGGFTTPILASEETGNVSSAELRKVTERIQRLEELLQEKEVRIQRLEAQLVDKGASQREITEIKGAEESRLDALETRLTAPFGGEFSLLPGGQSGPFGTGSDFFIAGAIDVLLLRRDPFFGQKLLGEVLIGYGRSTDQGVFTSPLSLFVPSLGLPSGSRIISNKLEVKFLQFFVGTKYKLVEVFNGSRRLKRL